MFGEERDIKERVRAIEKRIQEEYDELNEFEDTDEYRHRILVKQYLRREEFIDDVLREISKQQPTLSGGEIIGDDQLREHYRNGDFDEPLKTALYSLLASSHSDDIWPDKVATTGALQLALKKLYQVAGDELKFSIPIFDLTPKYFYFIREYQTKAQESTDMEELEILGEDFLRVLPDFYSTPQLFIGNYFNNLNLVDYMITNFFCPRLPEFLERIKEDIPAGYLKHIKKVGTRLTEEQIKQFLKEIDSALWGTTDEMKRLPITSLISGAEINNYAVNNPLFKLLTQPMYADENLAEARHKWPGPSVDEEILQRWTNRKRNSHDDGILIPVLKALLALTDKRVFGNRYVIQALVNYLAWKSTKNDRIALQVFEILQGYFNPEIVQRAFITPPDKGDFEKFARVPDPFTGWSPRQWIEPQGRLIKNLYLYDGLISAYPGMVMSDQRPLYYIFLDSGPKLFNAISEQDSSIFMLFTTREFLGKIRESSRNSLTEERLYQIRAEILTEILRELERRRIEMIPIEDLEGFVGRAAASLRMENFPVMHGGGLVDPDSRESRLRRRYPEFFAAESDEQ